eukprot:scaffold94864_cov69-Phaeocystis_antarctica.AAC.2
MKTATSPVAQSHCSTWVGSGWLQRQGQRVRGATRGKDDGGDRCALRGGVGRAGERHCRHLDAPKPVVRPDLGKWLWVGARHALLGIERLPLYG